MHFCVHVINPTLYILGADKRSVAVTMFSQPNPTQMKTELVMINWYYRLTSLIIVFVNAQVY